jgi:transcriptional regulator
MYVPAPYRETSPEAIYGFIERHGFGLLVSNGGSAGPSATHLPFALRRPAAPGGEAVLLGHMARANPQWQALDGAEVLAVFQGPHAYVSPSWYATRPAVPTWDYTAVHATGRFAVIDDPAEIDAAMAALVGTYEAEGSGWRFDALPADYKARMLGAIVTFAVTVTRFDASFKLNQNRPPADRRGVVAGLRRRGDPDGLAIADLIEGALAGE